VVAVLRVEEVEAAVQHPLEAVEEAVAHHPVAVVVEQEAHPPSARPRPDSEADCPSGPYC